VQLIVRPPPVERRRYDLLTPEMLGRKRPHPLFNQTEHQRSVRRPVPEPGTGGGRAVGESQSGRRFGRWQPWLAKVPLKQLAPRLDWRPRLRRFGHVRQPPDPVVDCDHLSGDPSDPRRPLVCSRGHALEGTATPRPGPWVATDDAVRSSSTANGSDDVDSSSPARRVRLKRFRKYGESLP